VPVAVVSVKARVVNPYRAVIADVNVVKNSSVVMITELSPPPWWLATTEPYSVLGGVVS